MATGSPAIEGVNGDKLTEPTPVEATVEFTEHELEFIIERIKKAPFDIALEIMQFITYKVEGSKTNG